ncbi:P-loop NTPase fold protein [Shewanella sp. 10N.261.52.F9]|uniref:KAP family P-loop NTPase fold protein n=1 Tax=Shewanella sp. 10N.261.52.F9 TaxID=3229684 RepID=UPI00355120FF
MKLEGGFDWSEELSIESGSQPLELLPPDRLGRKKYAEFIAKFLVSQGYDAQNDKRHNYVLNLNAEWGAGKTYFLKRLAEELKPHHPVVYIDAWKQDYSDDPLMTVISSMISQLREQAGKNADDSIYKAPRKAMGLLKAAAPAIVGGITKKFLGIDHVAILNAVEDEGDIGEKVTDEKGQPIDMGAAASQLVKHLIDEHDAKAKSIENLKVHVKEWVEAVIGLDQNKHKELKRRSFPAFVFIDELDRCRPSYAVEMLETIKYIFDIPGVVFVVGTDTEQLQHAVKAIYGEGFNARNYLGRFFNSRFTLRQPDIKSLLAVHCDSSKLTGGYFRDLRISVWPENESAEDNIANIAAVINCFNLPARTVIQITDRVIATLSNLPIGSKLDLLMLVTLLCFREKDEALFEDIMAGDFEREQKGYGNKLKLNQFMTINYKSKSIVVSNFEPALKLPDIRPNSGNKYANASYFMTLNKYFEIFSSFFSGDNTATNLILSRSREKSSNPIEELQVILKQLEPSRSNDNYRDEIGNTWLKYLYLDCGLDKLKSDDYKDLVELSSSLDWLDD